MPVAAADVRDVREHVPARPQRGAVLREERGLGIGVVALLRCEARGAASASGRLIPKSILLTRICSTVVMIVEPPGEPSASTGRPWSKTIVGAMLERGRLPARRRVRRVRSVKLKSVSSLLSRKPRPGTVMPLPPICSIVNV